MGRRKPSNGPCGRFSFMPEANLFLMFTQRLNALGVPYMVSGSVAAIIYGEPRLTHDVHLIVALDRQQLARLIEVFPPAEFHCPPMEVVAVEAAREERGHFNIIHRETGFKADVYLGGRDPFHGRGLARAAVGSGRPGGHDCASRVRHRAEARILPRRRIGEAFAGHSFDARHIAGGDRPQRTAKADRRAGPLGGLAVG